MQQKDCMLTGSQWSVSGERARAVRRTRLEIYAVRSTLEEVHLGA